MNIGSALRGYRYPTHLKAGCPRFHKCIASHKCQNYDQHNKECFLCEQRVYELNHTQQLIPLGGKLPEGKYQKDVQAAVAKLQNAMAKPMVNANAKGKQMTREISMASKYAEELKTLSEDLQHKGMNLHDD